jgi:rod shape-determining protein MreD
MKWTEIFFPFIFVWIIQLLFVDLLSIGTVRPDFPLIIILYFSVKQGRFAGVLSGFLFGLLIDLSGSAMFFGLSSLTYTIVGYISGNLKGVYNKISPILFTTSWVLVVFFQFLIPLNKESNVKSR